ncbi:hypothetical protein L6164_011365 [Bauhinia variegata]|uniref:Uncharacterized protein n=1 Tax=Bauhinia variegata TaxID=167791 RepID=A0ACB9P5S6_BAUVA|nr:hypothetical protein L6164_011365 [Bauhinia variegata]
MRTVTAKSSIDILNSQSSSALVLFHVPSLSRNKCKFLLVPSRKCTHRSKSLRLSSLRASCAPSSSIYGGWGDVEFDGGSDGPGESDALRNFLISAGIDDKKNIFVFLLGFVCAVAISRIKVSSILVLPASVFVFAIGFTVGFCRTGTFNDVKVAGGKRSAKEDNSNLRAEKLRNLLEFFDELYLKVNKLKSDVQNCMTNNKIKVGDLNGYVEVTDSIKLSASDARNIVRTLVDNEDYSSGVIVENHKTGRRKKEVGETGYQMLLSIGRLFGENLVSSNSAPVRENVKQETSEKTFDQTRGNNIYPPVEENGSFGTPHLSSRNSILDKDRTGNKKTTSENEISGLGGTDRSTQRSLDQKEYSYQRNRLRFKNNQSFSFRMDSNSKTDMWESEDNLLDSENLSVRMKHKESESSFMRGQMRNTAHETYRSSFHGKRENGSYRSQYREVRVDGNDHRDLADDLLKHESEFDTSSSSKYSDDVVFDRYLGEATDLLKEAKEYIKGRHDEEHAEIMLYRSANLLSKAVELKPVSLLAVGQLGNTYLLHGELKLKISRELRSLLSGSIQFSSGEHVRILKRMQNKITSEEDVAPLLIDVCEECEELLVEAGRKYRLAMSIDGNDVRALYNWGLALCFRGQLIADIGPGAAFEADRVFLAAIDKFDAMMSRGNVYAPDALFRWGATLQQRSRLRPASSKEKVKLLQQAKRLYEDALHMDSNNLQVKHALSSCISELNYRRL